MVLTQLLNMNSPIIYRNPNTDNESAQFLSKLFTDNFISVSVQDPPVNPNFSTLDDMLGGNDIILLGGPIVNSLSLNLQTVLQSSLPTGLQGLTFSVDASSDGTSVNTAPTFSFQNAQGAFSAHRAKSDYNAISDFASIIEIQGTSNRLIYISGVRDFGTQIASFVLTWCNRCSDIWPDTAYGPVSVLDGWKVVLSSSRSVFIQFDIPEEFNSLNSVDFKTQLDTSGSYAVNPQVANMPSIILASPEIKIVNISGPLSVSRGSGPHSVILTVCNNSGVNCFANPQLGIISCSMTFFQGLTDVLDDYVVDFDLSNPTILEPGATKDFNFSISVKETAHLGDVLLTGHMFADDSDNTPYTGVQNISFGWNVTSDSLTIHSFFSVVSGTEAIINKTRLISTEVEMQVFFPVVNSGNDLQDVAFGEIHFFRDNVNIDDEFEFVPSAPIAISAGQTTNVAIILHAKSTATAGAVNIQAMLNGTDNGMPISHFYSSPIIFTVFVGAMAMNPAIAVTEVHAGEIINIQLHLFNVGKELRDLVWFPVLLIGNVDVTNQYATVTMREPSTLALLPGLGQPDNSVSFDGTIRFDESIPSGDAIVRVYMGATDYLNQPFAAFQINNLTIDNSPYVRCDVALMASAISAGGSTTLMVNAGIPTGDFDFTVQTIDIKVIKTNDSSDVTNLFSINSPAVPVVYTTGNGAITPQQHLNVSAPLALGVYRIDVTMSGFAHVCSSSLAFTKSVVATNSVVLIVV